VSGEPAERLRGELAAVVQDLLAWASEHRDAGVGHRPASRPVEVGLIEDGEAA
jgi:hypothetical protein